MAEGSGGHMRLEWEAGSSLLYLIVPLGNKNNSEQCREFRKYPSLLDHLIGPPSKIRRLIFEILNERDVITIHLLDNANLNHHSGPPCAGLGTIMDPINQ